MHSWGPSSRPGTNRPPAPFGRESLAYPVFAAMHRRPLVVVSVFVVIILVLETRALAEDISGRRGEIVQLERELSLMPAEALGGRVG